MFKDKETNFFESDHSSMNSLIEFCYHLLQEVLKNLLNFCKYLCHVFIVLYYLCGIDWIFAFSVETLATLLMPSLLLHLMDFEHNCGSSLPLPEYFYPLAQSVIID